MPIKTAKEHEGMFLREWSLSGKARYARINLASRALVGPTCALVAISSRSSCGTCDVSANFLPSAKSPCQSNQQIYGKVRSPRKHFARVARNGTPTGQRRGKA